VVDPLYEHTRGQLAFDLGTLLAILLLVVAFAYGAVRRSATPRH
jgi:hypothetical protein